MLLWMRIFKRQWLKVLSYVCKSAEKMFQYCMNFLCGNTRRAMTYIQSKTGRVTFKTMKIMCICSCFPLLWQNSWGKHIMTKTDCDSQFYAWTLCFWWSSTLWVGRADEIAVYLIVNKKHRKRNRQGLRSQYSLQGHMHSEQTSFY